MMNRPPRRFYLFDGFRLDASERILFKGNREVPLTPKVFDTLLVLLENSNHVNFEDRGVRMLPGCGEWRLFAVQRSA